MRASPEEPQTQCPVERDAGKTSTLARRRARGSHRVPGRVGRRREGGQVLLALLLVLIVSTSYLLLKALNAALREARYQRNPDLDPQLVREIRAALDDSEFRRGPSASDAQRP